MWPRIKHGISTHRIVNCSRAGLHKAQETQTDTRQHGDNGFFLRVLFPNKRRMANIMRINAVLDAIHASKEK